MARLVEKTAIITGAAGGIGLATSTLFAQEGAKVLLVDINEQALQEAVAAIGSDAVSYAVADVTQPEQVQAYVRTALSVMMALMFSLTMRPLKVMSTHLPPTASMAFLAASIRAGLSLRFSIPCWVKFPNKM